MEELILMVAFIILVAIGSAIIIELISEEERQDSIIDALEKMVDEQELGRPLV